MRLFKRNGVYYLEYSRGRKKSLRTGNRGLAREILNEAIKDRALGRSAVKDAPLSDFAREYVISRQNNKAANTVRLDTEALGKFVSFLPRGIHVAEVTQKQGEEFLNKLLGVDKLKATTVNMTLRHVKGAFNKAIEWGYIDKSPLRYVRTLKIKDTLPRALTAEELNRLLAVIDKKEFREFVRACLYTAGRRESIAKLEWQDFKEYNGQWTVTLRKTKTKAHTIPLADKLKDVLFYRKKSLGPVFPYYHRLFEEASRHFKIYADRAGLNGVRLHDLRHTAATFMVLNGVPVRMVQEILGHSSIKMTEVYTRVAALHLRAGVNSIKF